MTKRIYNRRIAIGWLEDKNWSTVERNIARYLGDEAIELVLMASFFDVLLMKQQLKDLNREKVDLLVLDCKMEEEKHAVLATPPSKPTWDESAVQKAAELRANATNNTVICKSYYENLGVGGLYAWVHLQDCKAVPSRARTILYSADYATRAHYSVLNTLGLLRFYAKHHYIFPECTNPITVAKTHYREIANVGLNKCSFHDFSNGNTILIGHLDQINPEKIGSEAIHYIVDVERKEDGLDVSLLPLDPRTGIRECVRRQRRQTPFLTDLLDIGLEYARSGEVNQRILESVLEKQEDRYWEKPLSDSNNHWTLKTLFPAYYNEGGIYYNDSEERSRLEARIRRETFLNWTYEFGRVLRTGGYFVDGHKDPNTRCKWYDGNSIDVNQRADNIVCQKKDFQHRTGLALPADHYAGLVPGVAVPYYPRNGGENMHCMDRDLEKVKTVCQAEINAKGYIVKILGPFGGFYLDENGRSEAANARPMLCALPKPHPLGSPHCNERTLLASDKGDPSPWTLDRIFTRQYFEDVFKRECWNAEEPHAVAFCRGQVRLPKEGVAGCVGRYFRFACIARTTLRWSPEAMYGPSFLNMTKRGAWYGNGLHHHARVYLLSECPNGGKDLFFDLSKGKANGRDAVERPEVFEKAHELVARLLTANAHGINFCAYVYIGYDVVQGD